MTDPINFLPKSEDISRLTVSRDGNIKVIGKWNLIGRFIRWLRKDQENIAVINKIKEVLQKNKIDTVCIDKKNYNVTLLDKGRIEAILSNKALLAAAQPPTARKKQVDLAKTNDAVEIKFGNVTIKIDERVANKFPIFRDVMGDIGEKEILLDPNNAAISEQAIQDAIEFIQDPRKMPVSDPKRMIQMLVFLDYAGIDPGAISDLFTLYVRPKSEQIEPEFLVDLLFANKGFYEKCLMPLEIKEGPYNPEKFQNPKAKILFNALKEEDCLKYISTLHGNLLLELGKSFKPSATQLERLIKCLEAFPNEMQIRIIAPEVDGKDVNIKKLIDETSNKVIVDDPLKDPGSNYRRTEIGTKIWDSGRLDLLCFTTSDMLGCCKGVPKVEINFSDLTVLNLLEQCPEEIVFNDTADNDDLQSLLSLTVSNNLRHLKINSHSRPRQYYIWGGLIPASEWMVNSSNLESLDITSRHIETAPGLLRAFVGKTPKLQNFSVLCSEKTKIDCKLLADFLRKSPKLTHFCMQNVRVDMKNFGPLKETILNHPSLKTINGLDKQFFVDQVEELSKKGKS